MYYRITQPSDGVHQKLFALLQRVFESGASFAEDTKKLKKAVENGSCTVSEWRPMSGLARARKEIKP
jgi:hypothetical protein